MELIELIFKRLLQYFPDEKMHENWEFMTSGKFHKKMYDSGFS